MPATMLPTVLERLRGTPSRLAERLQGLSADALIKRRGESWSIQEIAGHFLDVESLWSIRLDDLAAGRKQLTEADLTNRRTWEANHNATSVSTILEEFRRARGDLIAKIQSFPDQQLTATALHPRLKVPMNVVDLGHFVAEHDDYHLAKITERLHDPF
jgi:uncharacterized damage-inducible protein DinB